MISLEYKLITWCLLFIGVLMYFNATQFFKIKELSTRINKIETVSVTQVRSYDEKGQMYNCYQLYWHEPDASKEKCK
jgi:hypothetical protein